MREKKGEKNSKAGAFTYFELTMQPLHNIVMSDFMY